MSDSGTPVCFHCGLPTESPEDGPRLNRLDDGQPCPVCAERLLSSLPSLVRDVAAELEIVEHEGQGELPLPDEPA